MQLSKKRQIIVHIIFKLFYIVNSAITIFIFSDKVIKNKELYLYIM